MYKNKIFLNIVVVESHLVNFLCANYIMKRKSQQSQTKLSKTRIKLESDLFLLR